MKARDTWYVVRKTSRILAVVIISYHVARTTLFAAGFLEQQAQLAWQDRDKPGKTEEAIKIWQQAVRAEPGRGDLWVDLAKAQGRAVRHAFSAKEREGWADQARASAEKAVALSSASAAAYAVYGEALGQWAREHKGIHSPAAVKQAIAALKTSITLDPKASYAHMLLSQFYRNTPKILGGNKDQALEEGKLAVLYGPERAINHLALGRAYLDLGHKEEGTQELRKVIALPAPPDAVPETRADQENARSLLRSLGASPASNEHPATAPSSPGCGEAAGVCTEQP